jgi:squalene-hopene/tetraprenyl-beta-curcumene cyclase
VRRAALLLSLACGCAGLPPLDPASADAVAKGRAFLVAAQNPDGSWDEHAFTGTGFPCVFYLKYHLYRTYFPLLALAEAKQVLR